jgi:DNA-binding GntR family transcriptional regulator
MYDIYSNINNIVQKEDGCLKQSNAIDMITSRNDITKLRTLLGSRPMELLLFEMGISSGLRISDLLNLRVRDLAPIDSIEPHAITIEPQVEAALREYLSVQNPAPDDFVFRKKRKNVPLSFSAITTIVKSWFEEAGIPGHFSSRSLYKTWQHNSMNHTDNSLETASSEQPLSYELTPININSVHVQVQEELYKGIITGTLSAGTRLSASRLASQLKVNVVHVRIALAHLEEQGLVETGKRKSCTVKALTPEDILEICDIRLLLEEFAFEKIRETWSPKTAVLLEQILERWELSRDLVECVHYHSIFHSMLYRDTHMPLLLDYIKNLSNRMNALHIRAYATTVNMKGQGDLDVDAHKFLLQTIQTGNFDKAKQLLHKNIVEGKANCLAHINMLRQNKSTQSGLR